ncbi:MAG: amidohydrolase [Clostridia bacterium]|nr:amidohydrolase [Clostridia bacterium]
MRLIKNGIVLTMEGDTYENGFVITNGKLIHAVGGMESLPSMEFESEFDACGGYIVPGFVDAHSHIGMWEDSHSIECDDGNDDMEPIMPQLRAIDAANPFDFAFREAAAAGVSCTVTGPGSANPIGGQMVAMKTFGRRIDDMAVKSCAAMKFAFGENPKSCHDDKHDGPTTRMGTAALIREALFKAREYGEKKRLYAENPDENDKPDFDFSLEALLPCLDGKMIVKAHAHRADDIFTAIRIKNEFGLKMSIEHCTDGHLIADLLAEEGVGACVGPSLTDRSKSELSNLSFRTASALSQANVRVAIITDHPEIPQKLLPLCAAMAVKAGMHRNAALRAITIDAARLCGIDAFVGSLKAGKDADVSVFDGYPVDFNSRPVYLMQNGVPLDIL